MNPYMKIYSEIIGNVNTDTNWAAKLKEAEMVYLDLDQWTAQKSRFVVTDSAGAECAMALRRHSRIENGDILEYDAGKNRAVVVRIDLKPVLVVGLEKIASRSPEEIIRRCVELGHAVGNQHWPAIVKGTKVYIPLTVDKKVMMSVMETHRFEDVTYEFQTGQEVLPFLSPHEVRQLFGGCSQELPHVHAHVH